MTTASSSKPTMIVVTAILSIVLAILNLCGGFAAVTGGAILGGLGSVVNQAAQEAGAELDAEAAAAAAAISGLGGGLFVIFGLVFLVIGIALLVDAIGLFQGKPWSWMLTIVLYSIFAVLTLISALTSNTLGIWPIIQIAVGAAIVYLFYTNADIKRALGKL
jgi:hypothetical protein